MRLHAGCLFPVGLARRNASRQDRHCRPAWKRVGGNRPEKGISLSRFYPVLLEKVLVEEVSEAVTIPSKASAKERILEAALEIFSQKGFHPATTDEIAERAGVGKGTLYRYFETKDKLFVLELVRH